MSETTVKFTLGERDIPTHWVNLMADLPDPAPPPLHPGTKEPAGPDDLAPLFPLELILQEVSSESKIEIPEQVRDVYKLWRPTPLHRRDGWSASSTRLRTSTTSLATTTSRPRSTPAGCATTATRRSCAGSSRQGSCSHAHTARTRRSRQPCASRAPMA